MSGVLVYTQRQRSVNKGSLIRPRHGCHLISKFYEAARGVQSRLVRVNRSSYSRRTFKETPFRSRGYIFFSKSLAKTFQLPRVVRRIYLFEKVINVVYLRFQFTDDRNFCYFYMLLLVYIISYIIYCIYILYIILIVYNKLL